MSSTVNVGKSFFEYQSVHEIIVRWKKCRYFKRKIRITYQWDIRCLKIYTRVGHATQEKRMIIKIGSTFRQLHHKVVREKRCVMIVHQRL